MKHAYQHEVVRHAKQIITDSHRVILTSYVGREVTVSSTGKRSVLASPLHESNGLYSVGRFQFVAEQVLSVIETPVGDNTVLLINI